MLTAIPKKDPRSVFSVKGSEIRAENQSQPRKSCRNEIRDIIQLCRASSKIQKPFIFISKHGIHRIDGFVKVHAHRTAQRHIKHRRKNAVTEILSYRLHCGLRHACFIQVVRIPTDNSGNSRSAVCKTFRLAGGQCIVHQHTFVSQRTNRKHLITQKALHRDTDAGMQLICQIQKSKAYHTGHRQRTDNQHSAACQLAPRCFWQNFSKDFFKQVNHLTDQSDRMIEPARIADGKVQKESCHQSDTCIVEHGSLRSYSPLKRLHLSKKICANFGFA